MLEKLRKNNKKGFTLVELIVVLVILAILAALLIPALTGYIDKAKEKQIIAETRQIVMAAQTLVDEEYAKLDINDTGSSITFDESENLENHTIGLSKVEELSEVKNLSNTNVRITVGNDMKVSKVEYLEKEVLCIYDASTSSYTTEKGKTSLPSNP